MKYDAADLRPGSQVENWLNATQHATAQQPESGSLVPWYRIDAGRPDFLLHLSRTPPRRILRATPLAEHRLSLRATWNKPWWQGGRGGAASWQWTPDFWEHRLMLDARSNGGGERRLDDVGALADRPDGGEITLDTADYGSAVPRCAGTGEGDALTPWLVLRRSLLESLRTGY